MTGNAAVSVVADRIEHVVELLDVVDATVGRRSGDGSHPEVGATLDRVREVISDQRGVLTERLEEIGAGGGHAATMDAPGRAAPLDGRDSAVLEQAIGALGEAMAAYERLYTTARLMFDAATCDLAADHLRTLREVVQILNWLLPDVVGRELEADGLHCRCTCPACSMGACLCVRNSTDTVLHAWSELTPFGTRGLPDPSSPHEQLGRWALYGLGEERGVVLRTGPRPGSPLAEAGLHRADRILAVDGAEVRSNAEIQDALMARDIGDEVHLKVERASGAPADVRVRRPQV